MSKLNSNILKYGLRSSQTANDYYTQKSACISVKYTANQTLSDKKLTRPQGGIGFLCISSINLS